MIFIRYAPRVLIKYPSVIPTKLVLRLWCYYVFINYCIFPWKIRGIEISFFRSIPYLLFCFVASFIKLYRHNSSWLKNIWYILFIIIIFNTAHIFISNCGYTVPSGATHTFLSRLIKCFVYCIITYKISITMITLWHNVVCAFSAGDMQLQRYIMELYPCKTIWPIFPFPFYAYIVAVFKTDVFHSIKGKIPSEPYQLWYSIYEFALKHLLFMNVAYVFPLLPHTCSNWLAKIALRVLPPVLAMGITKAIICGKDIALNDYSGSTLDRHCIIDDLCKEPKSQSLRVTSYRRKYSL